jgi:putative oxidoreductase
MLSRIVGTAAPWSILPARIVLGFIFMMHGGQKLFVFGLPGVARFLGGLGFHPAMFWAVIVTFNELLGGIAVLTGFLTRWAALLIAIEMTVVILRVKLTKGLFQPQGFELELALWAICLTLVLTGPGKPSIDQALHKE